VLAGIAGQDDGGNPSVWPVQKRLAIFSTDQPRLHPVQSRYGRKSCHVCRSLRSRLRVIARSSPSLRGIGAERLERKHRLEAVLVEDVRHSTSAVLLPERQARNPVTRSGLVSTCKALRLVVAEIGGRVVIPGDGEQRLDAG